MRLLTIGTWDVPHIGHASFLRKCEAFANEIVVGVNTDEFVWQYKKAAPRYRYAERFSLIAELGYRVIRNDSAGRECIEAVKPDILAIGSDWARKDYMAQIDVDQDWLDDRGIAMLYLPYTRGISSTELKARLSPEIDSPIVV